jgi:hypothetical protein
MPKPAISAAERRVLFMRIPFKRVGWIDWFSTRVLDELWAHHRLQPARGWGLRWL